MPAVDLGECQQPWCSQPAVAYVSGPTLGRSPRVTVIGGERAAQMAEKLAAPADADLTAFMYGAMQCIDCVLDAVTRATGHEPVGPAPTGPLGGP